MKKLHTVAEAAEALNVSTNTIRYHIRKGGFETQIRKDPGSKPVTVFDIEDIKQCMPWIEETV